MPGLLLWLLVSRLGYMSALIAIVIILGAFWGYGFLNKEVDKKGIYICIAVCIVMIYISVHLSWSGSVHRIIPDIPYETCASQLWKILKTAECVGSFIKDLLISYTFLTVGFFYCLKKI